MPKKQSLSPKTNAPLAIFATILVVAGIVASAWFSSHKTTTTQNATSTTPVVDVVPNKDLSTNDILLQNETSITVLHLDGKSERLSYDDFSGRYKLGYPMHGVSVANGSPVVLSLKADALPSGSIDPSGAYVAHLGQPKEDGASTIEISENNTVSQSIVLRDSIGHPLKDALIIGWLSPRIVVASVVSTSSRYAYGFDRDGRVTQLASLPESLAYQSIQCGQLWYATAVLGQGLESAPTGPSDLYSVDAMGDVKTIAHDDSRVFSSLVCGDAGIAYRLDNGEASYLPSEEEAKKVDLGKRTPLAILSDGRILLRDNFELILLDLATQEVTELGSVPEGEVKAFVVPKVLDL